MPAQWDLLPLEILTMIFSYLNRRDRLSCSMVCSQWNYNLNTPKLWYDMVITLDTDLMEPSTMILTREYHMFIRHIEFRWSKPQMLMRWFPHNLQEISKRACRFFLMLIEKNVQLQTIKLHGWYDLIRMKKIVFLLTLFLKSQTKLNKLCFSNALLNKSDFIKLLVACRKSEDVISQLDIHSCICHSEMNLFSMQFMECIERLSNLRLLKIDYSTFRTEVMQVLLRRKNKKLQRLEIYFRNDDMIPISNDDWAKLSKQLEELSVALHFINIVNINEVLLILQKSIPLQTFSLVTVKGWNNHNHNSCYEMFRVLASSYKKTLEVLDVRLRDNIDIPDQMLLEIIKQCKKLNIFQFSGVISDPNIIREMCKIQVEQNACKYIEVAARHMNSEAHFSMIKLLEELTIYKRNDNIDFKIHNTKFRNSLYVYY